MHDPKELISRFVEELWNERRLDVADAIPASGTKLQIRMFTVHRIVQGKIIEDWVLVDSLGVFQQLGVVANTADLVDNFLRQRGNC